MTVVNFFFVFFTKPNQKQFNDSHYKKSFEKRSQEMLKNHTENLSFKFNNL